MYLLLLLFGLVVTFERGASAGCSQCNGPSSPLSNGTLLPCMPGNELCPASCASQPNEGHADLGPWGKDVGYHIRDRTCGLNDPNGPVYDAKHGVYHLFYQDHLGIGGGVVWGHAASRDLKKWVHLPVALWNDQFYDNSAIFSGSATVVDGEIVLTYPGLCDVQKACIAAGGTWTGNRPGKCNVVSQCQDGRNIALAVPADPTDPLMTNWTKLGPIINASKGCAGHCNASVGDNGKDPSTAWKNPSGEWQMVTGGSPVVFGSMDFKNGPWYYIGLGFTTKDMLTVCNSFRRPPTPFMKGVPQGNGGDCPSFFPLPAFTPGAGPAPNASIRAPTHVHMAFGGMMTLGWYTPGAEKTLGTFEELPTSTHRKSDHGQYYATKDFYDPVKDRRILWGWGVPPLNAQSLPREMTWNPELQQLCYNPLEEQASLRTNKLPIAGTPKTNMDIARTSLRALAAPHVISKGWPTGAGNQSEIEVTFVLPTANTVVGLVVMAGADPSSSGTFFFVDYKTAEEVHPGVAVAAGVGGDGEWPRTVTVGAMYNRTASSGPGFSCLEAGVICANDTLQLLPSDSTLTMRAFVDNNLAECYWQTNRVSIMITAPPTAEAAVALVNSGGAVNVDVSSASAWQVGGIWITKDELLATRRADSLQQEQHPHPHPHASSRTPTPTPTHAHTHTHTHTHKDGHAQVHEPPISEEQEVSFVANVSS